MKRWRWQQRVAVAAAWTALAMVPACAGKRPSPAGVAKPVVSTTIILVRHGEREDGFNPPLNEAGVARAEALVEVLAQSGVTAIYAPELVRTLQTAQPLADRLEVPIQRIALVRLVAPERLARDVVGEILKRHAGEVVLYVGNDSNLEAIYRHLGGQGEPPVRHHDLYVAVIGGPGEVRFIRARFGRVK